MTWINVQAGTLYEGDCQPGDREAADADLLPGAKSTQLAIITAAYNNAICLPLSYTTVSSVTKTYQADANSQDLLQQTTQGYSIAGSTPSGFYWIAADNTKVPFTLADLKALYLAMLAQGWAAFQQLQALKAQINAAATVADVQAIVWP